MEYYKDSILYNPRQAIYRYQLCDAYLFMLRKDLNNIDLINQTIKEGEEIIRIDPNEDFALSYLANAYDLLEYNTKKIIAIRLSQPAKGLFRLIRTN